LREEKLTCEPSDQSRPVYPTYQAVIMPAETPEHLWWACRPLAAAYRSAGLNLIGSCRNSVYDILNATFAETSACVEDQIPARPLHQAFVVWARVHPRI